MSEASRPGEAAVRFKSVIAVSLSLALTGCGSGNSLSTDKAAELILTYQTGQCSTDPPLWSLTVGGGDGAFTVPKNESHAIIDRWFANEINSDSSITRDDATAQQRRLRAVYTATENGAPVYLEYKENGEYRYYSTYYEMISFCWYVPDKIDVLDITPEPDNPKAARVTFKQTGRPSIFYRKAQTDLQAIASAAFQRADANNAASDGGECVATLQRLDETGWRVTGAGCQ